MRILLSSSAILFLSIGLHATPVAAQTTAPARDTATHQSLSEKLPLVETQGAYVAPGQTGAPKQKVLTDYDNNPIRPAAKEAVGETSLSAGSADKEKARRLKTKRAPKRD